MRVLGMLAGPIADWTCEVLPGGGIKARVDEPPRLARQRSGTGETTGWQCQRHLNQLARVGLNEADNHCRGRRCGSGVFFSRHCRRYVAMSSQDPGARPVVKSSWSSQAGMDEWHSIEKRRPSRLASGSEGSPVLMATQEKRFHICGNQTPAFCLAPHVFSTATYDGIAHQPCP
jgi:ribosomal protein S27AE